MAAAAAANAEKAASWGPFEPFYRILHPLAEMLSPLLSGNIGLVVIGVLLMTIVLRLHPSPSQDKCTSSTTPQRLAAYDELWRREESDLWNWLEDRVGMDGMSFPRFPQSQLRHKAQSRREVAAKMRDQNMSNREVARAIRTTRERLDILEDVLGHKNGLENENNVSPSPRQAEL